MEFSQKFFEGEIRSGFYVQPIMKRVWAAQLEVLKEIEAVCKRHGIKFFAQWGTLLGAVRHQGFIPWDDDIDLGMLREDYEKFRYYAKKELPESWRVADCNDSDYDELLIRVVNTREITLEQRFLKRFHGCPYVVGVDIFCMDRIPRNKGEEEILLKLLSMTDVVGINWDEYEDDKEKKGMIVRDIEELTGYHFDRQKSIKKQMLFLADKISGMYWDAESDELTMMFWLAEHPNYRFPNSCFEQIIELPFENIMIPVPRDYDLVCRLNYGEDYMTPRKKYYHAYPFFKAQIEELRKQFAKKGETLPECYDMIDGEEI